MICVGFAAGDEYHQSFLPSMGVVLSVVDVGIDSVGVFFGILTVRIVCFLFLAPARILESGEDVVWSEKQQGADRLPADLTVPMNVVPLRQQRAKI